MDTNPIPTPTIIQNNPKNKFIIPILIAFALILLFAAAYFTLTQKNDSSKKDGQLFKNQTAVIDGQIASRNGNRLTVKNTEGVVSDLELSDKVTITDNTSEKTSTPSTDLKNIKINRDAQIVLNLINNKLLVTSITYQNTSDKPVGIVIPTNVGGNNAAPAPQVSQKFKVEVPVPLAPTPAPQVITPPTSTSNAKP